LISESSRLGLEKKAAPFLMLARSHVRKSAAVA
jgi:hypothetical protein